MIIFKDFEYMRLSCFNRLINENRVTPNIYHSKSIEIFVMDHVETSPITFQRGNQRSTEEFPSPSPEIAIYEETSFDEIGLGLKDDLARY